MVMRLARRCCPGVSLLIALAGGVHAMASRPVPMEFVAVFGAPQNLSDRSDPIPPGTFGVVLDPTSEAALMGAQTNLNATFFP